MDDLVLIMNNDLDDNWKVPHDLRNTQGTRWWGWDVARVVSKARLSPSWGWICWSPDPRVSAGSSPRCRARSAEFPGGPRGPKPGMSSDLFQCETTSDWRILLVTSLLIKICVYLMVVITCHNNEIKQVHNVYDVICLHVHVRLSIALTKVCPLLFRQEASRGKPMHNAMQNKSFNAFNVTLQSHFRWRTLCWCRG